ncbi:MAG: hypothetical protein ACLVJ6_11255 [Merdibacter sp.]
MSQYAPRLLGDVTISSKGKNLLTNNAIILALLVLVVIICIKERKFMQVRVVLDILTQSSTKLIIALGICFTLLIAGTDLSAGRMVGLASVISCSMLQTATYANRFSGPAAGPDYSSGRAVHPRLYDVRRA